VEYDYDSFESVTVGVSADDAYARVTRYRANPGGTTVYLRADSPEECARFDAMRRALSQD